MELVLEPREGGIAVLRLKGRLDLLSAASAKQQIAAAVADGHNRLVVDLGDVEFIDSSGLGALIGGLKSARLAGGDMRIARPSDQARMILELTNLNRVLKAYAGVEEALSGYS